MNIFGVGPLEIIFVLIIGILILGPEGMVEAGRKMGKFMHSLIHSTWWQNLRRGVQEIQQLPQRLIQEAELEEFNQVRKLTKDSLPSIGNQDLIQSSPWAGQFSPDLPSNTEEQPDTEDLGHKEEEN